MDDAETVFEGNVPARSAAGLLQPEGPANEAESVAETAGEKDVKLIFLDIDGVMNHRGYFVRSDKHHLQAFCPRSVQNLKLILEATGAKIIVSSTWRKLWPSTRKMKSELFRHYGLDRFIYGRTPVLDDVIRGVEIQRFLDQYHWPVERFVILDDDDDMGDLLPHLVQTSFEGDGGITDEVRDRAIELLNG